MSSFEFILISIAIVVGFGISEVLAGWGRQLRHRYEIRPYPLQVVASAYILSVSLRFLWTTWTLRELQWTYLSYLLIFIPALLIALSAHLIRVDVTGLRRTPREQYFTARRPLFGLLIAFPGFALLNLVYHADYYRALYGTGSNFQPSLPVAIVGFAWMLFSENPRHHWIGWALVWAANLYISVTVLPTLGAP